jgi:DNA-binding CsgD family transcriptional regulator
VSACVTSNIGFLHGQALWTFIMEIILPKNHILYSSADELKQICAPLRSCFGVETFAYVKIYPDLSRVHLDTNAAWSEFFYKHAYRYHQINRLTESKHWEPGYSVLYMLDDSECIKDSHEFDIGNGVVIADHVNGCTELVCFVLSYRESKSKLVGLLNNIDLLQKFIIYFKNRAVKILENAEKQKIILPFLEFTLEKASFSFKDEIRRNFLETITPSQIIKNNLTQRELECIRYSAKDMSAKQVAKLLHISPRTVEKHLANAKEKLACSKKGSLIQFLEQF